MALKECSGTLRILFLSPPRLVHWQGRSKLIVRPLHGTYSKADTGGRTRCWLLHGPRAWVPKAPTLDARDSITVQSVSNFYSRIEQMALVTT